MMCSSSAAGIPRRTKCEVSSSVVLEASASSPCKISPETPMRTLQVWFAVLIRLIDISRISSQLCWMRHCSPPLEIRVRLCSVVVLARVVTLCWSGRAALHFPKRAPTRPWVRIRICLHRQCVWLLIYVCVLCDPNELQLPHRVARCGCLVGIVGRRQRKCWPIRSPREVSGALGRL